MSEVLEIRCPHCHKAMVQWQNPQLSSWSSDYQYVCFNDDCPYFVRGWGWMQSQFNVTASYRHRFDPSTGEDGPLPVWSSEALRSNIIQKKEAIHA
jgi:hypothetical protein